MAERRWAVEFQCGLAAMAPAKRRPLTQVQPRLLPHFEDLRQSAWDCAEVQPAGPRCSAWEATYGGSVACPYHLWIWTSCLGHNHGLYPCCEGGLGRICVETCCGQVFGHGPGRVSMLRGCADHGEERALGHFEEGCEDDPVAVAPLVGGRLHVHAGCLCREDPEIFGGFFDRDGAPHGDGLSGELGVVAAAAADASGHCGSVGHHLCGPACGRPLCAGHLAGAPGQIAPSGVRRDEGGCVASCAGLAGHASDARRCGNGTACISSADFGGARAFSPQAFPLQPEGSEAA